MALTHSRQASAGLATPLVELVAVLAGDVAEQLIAGGRRLTFTSRAPLSVLFALEHLAVPATQLVLHGTINPPAHALLTPFAGQTVDGDRRAAVDLARAGDVLACAALTAVKGPSSQAIFCHGSHTGGAIGGHPIGPQKHPCWGQLPSSGFEACAKQPLPRLADRGLDLGHSSGPQAAPLESTITPSHRASASQAYCWPSSPHTSACPALQRRSALHRSPEAKSEPGHPASAIANRRSAKALTSWAVSFFVVLITSLHKIELKKRRKKAPLGSTGR